MILAAVSFENLLHCFYSGWPEKTPSSHTNIIIPCNSYRCIFQNVPFQFCRAPKAKRIHMHYFRVAAEISEDSISNPLQMKADINIINIFSLYDFMPLGMSFYYSSRKNIRRQCDNWILCCNFGHKTIKMCQKIKINPCGVFDCLCLCGSVSSADSPADSKRLAGFQQDSKLLTAGEEFHCMNRQAVLSTVWFYCC